METRDASGGGGVEPRASGTPDGDALDQAERAFELGRFADVRRIVAPLLASTSPEVASAARELHRRVSVDPAQIAVVVACLGLLATIVARYVL